MQLSQLRQKVEDILIDVPTVVEKNIDSEIDAAQVEAEDRHPFKVMESIFQETIAYQENRFEKPSDWIRSDPNQMPYYVGFDGTTLTNNIIQWIPTHSDVLKLYGSDVNEEGHPIHISDGVYVGPNTFVDEFGIYPRADDEGDWGGYLIRVPYLKRISLPSTMGTSENWFMANAARYLIFKAASELLTMNRDHEESQLYALKAEREIRRMIRLDKRSKLKGDTLPLQRDVKAPFNQRLR